MPLSSRSMTLRPPVGGINKRGSYQRQAPYTTPDCLNMRPDEVSTGRERMGGRPGTQVAGYVRLDSSNAVNMLAQMTIVEQTGHAFWEDTFQYGSTLGAWWSPLEAYADYVAKPTQEDGIVRNNVAGTYAVAKTVFSPTISTTGDHYISLKIVPVDRDYVGVGGAKTYEIYGRMDNTTPDPYVDGFVVSFTHGRTGNHTGSLKVFDSDTGDGTGFVETTFSVTSSGYADPGWLRVAVTNSGARVQVFYNELTLTAATAITIAATGRRVGFGLKNTGAATDRLHAEAFRVEYIQTGANQYAHRQLLMSAAAGKLFKEDYLGSQTQADSGGSVTLASDRKLYAVEALQKLYIADYAEPKAAASDGQILGGFVAFDSASYGDWTAINVSVNDDVLIITEGSQEVHTVEITGSPSGGTFTLIFQGEETDPIAFNGVTNAIVQTALENLPSYYPGDFHVSYAAPIFTITYRIGLAGVRTGVLSPMAYRSSNLEGAHTDIDIKVTVTDVANTKPIAGAYTIGGATAGQLVVTSSMGSAMATGVEFQVMRGMKVYDYATDTISIWQADAGKGAVPHGCKIIALWGDRLVLAGDSNGPHAWYMSRKGDPLDWDYSRDDESAAIAGVTAEAGLLGEEITALIPHTDLCLVVGTRSGMWVFRNDPASGGTLDNLSREVGVLDAGSWCHTPEGWLYMLTTDGVYIMPPGCGDTPLSISREVLPDELQNINPLTTLVQMEYDVKERGVHIMIVPKGGEGTGSWWFLDNKVTLSKDNPNAAAFFKFEFSDVEHEPESAHNYVSSSAFESSLVIGSRDGYVRKFDPAAWRDHREGGDVDVENAGKYRLTYGPIRIPSNDHDTGILADITGVVGQSSADVTWQAEAYPTMEEAVLQSPGDEIPTATGTWTPGLNYKYHARLGGRAAWIKLTGSKPIAVDRVTLTMRSKGKQRKHK